MTKSKETRSSILVQYYCIERIIIHKLDNNTRYNSINHIIQSCGYLNIDTVYVRTLHLPFHTPTCQEG